MTYLGLRDVSTAQLKTLLRYLHQGELICPLTPAEFARIGLQEQTNACLGILRGLDATAVRAVLTAVLMERLPPP